MLMFDRIVKIDDKGGRYGKGEIVAELDVKPDLWFFACHFKGDPVMPGCLPLDALWQLLGFFLGWMKAPGRGRALGVGEVKFNRHDRTDGAQAHLPCPPQARDAAQARAGHRRRRRSGPTASRSTK